MDAHETPPRYAFGDFTIDVTQRRLFAADGSRVTLSSRGFELLLFMVEHPGEMLEKRRLLDAVWPQAVVEENNLNQTIGAVRRALGESPGEHKYLVTETGRGYRFVATVRRIDQHADPRIDSRQIPNAARRPASALAIGAVIASALLLGLLVVALAWRTEEPAPAERTIAVLPFENRSESADNAYLAQGIQDEILTLLSRVSDLRVVSRMSAHRFAAATTSAADIARDLGVTYLLEGSVQKAGSQVRINVKLIDALSDRHLWAQSYERDADDVFAIESDVAQAVAQALQARLTSAERRHLTQAPTAVPAAYDAYLRARAYAERTTRTESEIRDAIASFEQAVRLDPQFATAWAQLSRRQANFFSLSYDRSPQRRDLAKTALQRAEQLAPDSFETLAARSYYLFRVEGDFLKAEAAFREQERRAPGNADGPSGLAQLMRELGHHKEALASYQKIVAAEPQNPYRQTIVCEDYLTLREFGLALKTCDRVLDLLPNDVGALAIKASIYQSQGELDRSRALLAGLRPAPGDWRTLRTMSYQHLLDREPAAAVALLQDYLSNPDALGTRRGVLRRWLADAQRAAGAIETARRTYGDARVELVRELARQPANALLTAELAIVETQLGASGRALELARKCVSLAVKPKQITLLANCALASARVDLETGNAAGAVQTLRGLMAQNGGFPPLTIALLRLDPQWDRLKSRPDFHELPTS